MLWGWGGASRVDSRAAILSRSIFAQAPMDPLLAVFRRNLLRVRMAVVRKKLSIGARNPHLFYAQLSGVAARDVRRQPGWSPPQHGAF